jgi:hypothetical protein
VHETHRRAAVAQRLDCAILAQGIDVVDQLGAAGSGFAHHRRVPGIDRQHAVEAGAQRLHHRHHALDLLRCRHRLRAGPGRLATDIEDRGARLQHLLGVPQGSVDRAIAAAVGKRIGGDIEHPHHQGAHQTELALRQLQPALTKPARRRRGCIRSRVGRNRWHRCQSC